MIGLRDTVQQLLMNFQILFLLHLQYQSFLRFHFRLSRKYLKLSFSSYVLFREDVGLSGCKQVLQLRILMIFIIPWLSLIVDLLLHFASRIHRLTITSNSCALQRPRESHLNTITEATSLLSIQ